MAYKSQRKTPLLPIDENVVIPPAVLARTAQTEALHAAAYPQEPAPAEPEPIVSPIVSSVEVAPVVVEPVAVQPLEVAAPVVEPVVVPPIVATPAADQSWEHKYLSMKGRFERADNLSKQLGERVTGLEGLIATLQTAPVPVVPVAPEPTAALFTAQERESYGDDFLEVVRRGARAEINPEVETLRNAVKNIEQQVASVGGVIAQTAQDKMHTYLNEHVPNWVAMNDQEGFYNWVLLPDPYSGAIRQALLKAAYAANDGPRVAAFFKGFLAEEAALAPRPEPTPTVPAALEAPKVPLETFAAPGRAKTAASEIAPAEKPLITRAQITQFYVDVSSGKYVGKEAEKARIDQMIFAAQRDGRIR